MADFHIGQTVDGKTEILVAAAAKNRMSEFLENLDLCGIDAIAVELDVAALINTAEWAGVIDGNCVIIDIGEQTTKVVVIRDGDVVFWRAFRTRGSR